MTRWAPLALGMALLLGGCGDDAGDARDDAAADGSTTSPGEPLPKPEGAIGSVTGMPANPGPGTSRIEPIEPVAIGAAGDALESQPGVQGSDPQIIHVPPPDDVDVDLAVADIVPDPPEPQRLPVPPRPPAMPDPSPPPSSTPNAAPIGTEGATESTTFVTEPDAAGDTDD